MEKIITFLTGLGIVSSVFCQDNCNRVKPNIILIMADDLGYGDLGCYGQQKIKTPNIDRLATDGMIFTQAYSGATVCAPSRCSLMTGFHNGHNRIRDNLPSGIYLRPDDFTIAELLKMAGYQTGGVGKWGLGIEGTWGLPNKQGFDYWYGHYNQDQAHFYYPDFLWENDKLVLMQDLVITNGIGEISGNRGGKNKFYSHDLFTEKANDFIIKNKDHPFFLYVAYTIPHYSDYPKGTPEYYIVPSDEPYSEKKWPQIAKNYAAMITRMDTDVGKLMKLIKELYLEENTIVIFTSDNGPNQEASTPIEFFDSNGPLRGWKRDSYEGGIRIPFIVKWKNMIPNSSKNDKIIAFWDIMPTFADIIDYPGKIETDGVSFLPILTGGKVEEHKFLYWDYGHVRETYSQTVRYGDYKGIQQFSKGAVRFELFNLQNDIQESKNIALDFPVIVKTIQSFMKESYTFSNVYDISEHLK